MVHWLLHFDQTDGFGPNGRVLCNSERGSRDRRCSWGIGTLDLETVTSRSGGLRGWYHSLLLLFLSNMRPVHISLDLQGVCRIYDLL